MTSFTTFKGSEDGSIKKSTTSKPELKGDQVAVKVTASGVCGTDLHYNHADMVLGHEGVGVITAVGPEVTHMKVGDRVGWGYLHGSCGHCDYCLTGNETFCPEVQMYGIADLDQGSFATGAVWNEKFLFKIPDEIEDEVAAPLQCGGATVFTALDAFDNKPTETVGVMGIGGLGHLAIQFAAKMGNRVVVLSGSENKKEEAFKLGASEFISTKGTDELQTSHKINRLLVTTSSQPEWSRLIPILASRAVIVPLSVAGGDFSIPYTPLVMHGLRVIPSIVASRWVHKRMLEFAALHQIKPIIEKFPMTEDGITAALAKLGDSSMRYRGVVVPQAA